MNSCISFAGRVSINSWCKLSTNFIFSSNSSDALSDVFMMLASRTISCTAGAASKTALTKGNECEGSGSYTTSLVPWRTILNVYDLVSFCHQSYVIISLSVFVHQDISTYSRYYVIINTGPYQGSQGR